MPCRVLLGLATLAGALALAQAAAAGPAGPHRADRDQVEALRMAVDWLTTYPEPLWVGVALPGRCEELPSGRRACPVSIDLLAWTRGELAPWRGNAHVLLPAPGSSARARRTSADCGPVSEPIAQPPRRLGAVPSPVYGGR
jgi:hypothetical protein